MPPEEYVDTRGGTLSKVDVSHGNVLPEVVVPWGMNGWTPVSDTSEGSWFFYPETRRFYGIRCTHRGSVWAGDWGQARIMASVMDPQHSDVNQYSGYDPLKGAWSPYLNNVTLLAFGGRNGYTTVETTPTFRGAIIRVKFPAMASGPASGWNQTRRIQLSFDQGGHTVAVGTESTSGFATLSGVSTAKGAVPAIFGHYYYMTVSGGGGTIAIKPFSTGVTTGQNPWAFLDFDPSDPATNFIVIRIATSLISGAQAQLNHATEVSGVTFETAMAAAKAAWSAELSRISVNDIGPGYSAQQQTDLMTTFYTSLYRASKYPRTSFEIDAKGDTVHWSPYTGQILQGTVSEGSGW